MQYPDHGYTKSQLALYYESIADWMLPWVTDRLLTLVRCPRGRQEKCFYQKHHNESVPEHVYGSEVVEKNKKATYLVIKDVAGLVSLVQIGVLEMHPWGSRIDKIERPDLLVWDLDPGPGVNWKELVAGAELVRDSLEEIGLKSWPRTTGGKGLHVVAPIARRTEWDDAKAFTKAVAESIVRHDPSRYIATMSKAKRKGKIYVDYLRNGRGATAIANYSTRARPGAPVATPLSWDELTPSTDLRDDHYNITNVPKRLASLKTDPWAEFTDTNQSITAAMRQAVGME